MTITDGGAVRRRTRREGQENNVNRAWREEMVSVWDFAKVSGTAIQLNRPQCS